MRAMPRGIFFRSTISITSEATALRTRSFWPPGTLAPKQQSTCFAATRGTSCRCTNRITCGFSAPSISCVRRATFCWQSRKSAVQRCAVSFAAARSRSFARRESAVVRAASSSIRRSAILLFSLRRADFHGATRSSTASVASSCARRWRTATSCAEIIAVMRARIMAQSRPDPPYTSS